MIKVVPGNLLDSIDEYIVQLNDCTSTVPKGFSKEVVECFPWANPYGQRRTLEGFEDLAEPSYRPDPGTIEIFGDENRDERMVVSFYAQVGSGRSYTGHNANRYWIDGSEERKQWFKMCLDELADLKPFSVGFPYGIGCGYAGGKWEDYEDMLQDFADTNPKCRVNMFIGG